MKKDDKDWEKSRQNMEGKERGEQKRKEEIEETVEGGKE